MNSKYKIVFSVLISLGVVCLAFLLLRDHNFAVLNPKGQIADQQRDLIFLATGLMLIVVIPVFILTFFIAWKYREGNASAKYTPDWDHNRAIEFTWWALPSALILILATVTWQNTHQLDPTKPLASATKPITIQVVALQWKWLFIYPEQSIASVNFLQIPQDTPINFELTADAPMNSFWIPSLGGQIYTMPGMNTKLHLIANELGSYAGSSANISGQGFAGMKFTAKASTRTDFDNWVQTIQDSTGQLSYEQYEQLAMPSSNNAVTYYSSTEDGLYDKLIMKYMAPAPQLQTVSGSTYHDNHETGSHH